jgi:hypothetical protein
MKLHPWNDAKGKSKNDDKRLRRQQLALRNQVLVQSMNERFSMDDNKNRIGISKSRLQYNMQACSWSRHSLLSIDFWTASSTYASLTKSPAMPCPLPMHILVNKIFFPVLLHSLRPVTICLAPVAPSGCPKAMAPPLGFNLASGTLSVSLQYTAIDAKASLISTMSTSSRVMFSLVRSLGMARDGPMPIMRGARPVTVAATNLARIG